MAIIGKSHVEKYTINKQGCMEGGRTDLEKGLFCIPPLCPTQMDPIPDY